eukprot:TRINITY_DN26799_c0_g1_i1.p1 TRINITY_DN26799_c0_g1~~TRINITY_DN26799_c0_g1_i1.p1  ORF type:complete len:213 (-),score=56.30 TRINITY_DN26799_c0_g1_i1:179-775(-)
MDATNAGPGPSWKFVVVGDFAVGKTAYLRRLMGHEFTEYIPATVCTDLMVKRITVDNLPVTLQLWDTAGTERYRSFTRAFQRGAHGTVLMFDITSRRSWDAVPTLYDDAIHDAVPPGAIPEFVVVGNKADLAAQRQVNPSEINQWCTDHKVPYFEVSSKYGTNVDDSLKMLVEHVAVRAPTVLPPCPMAPPEQKKNCC